MINKQPKPAAWTTLQKIACGRLSKVSGKQVAPYKINTQAAPNSPLYSVQYWTVPSKVKEEWEIFLI